MRRAPAASRKAWRKQGGRRRRGSKRAKPVLQRWRARPLSPDPSHFDRLKVGCLSNRKLNEAAVHLSQTGEEDRYINVFVLARLKRTKPTVKEGVFDSVNQMRNNSIQSKCKSFATVIAGYEFKHQNLSNCIDFSFCEVLVDKAVSQARNGLRIHADDLLTDIPITHVIPHGPESFYCRKRFVSFLPYVSYLKYKRR
jgi:hypothetical protein